MEDLDIYANRIAIQKGIYYNEFKLRKLARLVDLKTSESRIRQMMYIIVSVIIGIVINLIFPYYVNGNLAHTGIGTCITIGLISIKILNEIKELSKKLDK